MCKRASLMIIFVFISFSFGFNPRMAKPQKLVKAPRMIESNSTTSSSGKIYWGNNDGMFGESANGFGWYKGYNRKVQANYDPLTGAMFSSIYRRYNPATGSGTIGGMAGEIEGDPTNPSFLNSSQIIYDNSIYQTEGTDPGGRYPYMCEFINGYGFGIFNEKDTAFEDSVSHPMFTVCDATFGYNFTSWSEPIRVESADSNYVIQNAWQGTGDVVYDPSTGYYYWTQGWREGLNYSEPGFVLSCVVGRTLTPSDANSWEWTDYNDLRFTTFSLVDTPYLQTLERIHFAYAKDIQGNGTGYGIGVAMTTYVGETNPYLSYIYTSNWGADDTSGSLRSNWNAPALSEFIYRVDTAELFDWYGETLTMYDSIGYDIVTGEVIYDSTTVVMDDPFIAWDISAVTTENNIVHVLMKVFPASTQDTYTIYPWTDNGFRSGYYDVRGEITETGVVWDTAILISNFVDTDKGWEVEDNGIEWKYDNHNTLSISYAGYGQFFAGWLDKPVRSATPLETDSLYNLYKYYDDGYTVCSLDDGVSWENYYTYEIETGIPEDPTWTLKYAANSTGTEDIIDEGWSFSNHGGYYYGVMHTYAACQYSDPAGSEGSYLNNEQFLSVWCVAYTPDGIQAEEVSIAKDFDLSQNYPNPFNPNTSIKFILQNNADVKLSVYNSKGELVSNLKNDKMAKGSHSVNFDATNLNSGLYFYTLKVNNKSETKKMMLIK